MLNIERLIVVIDANFEEALVHPRHYANVEEALKKLVHLREAHFRVSFMDEEVAGTLFHESIRAGLPRAHEAGLVTFSRRCWCRQFHPMRHFSQ
jgi:hypothetical protein